VGSPSLEHCPNCGADVPVHFGFLTWCECGWNLTSAQRSDESKTRFDRLYAAAGRRLGDRLVSELLTADQLEPRLTPPRIAAYAIAGGVHLFTAALAIGGVVLGVLAFPNPAALVAALIMVGLAWLMRPRLGKVPDEGLVTRDEAPRLYALTDAIADALGVPGVHVIVIDHEFNASWMVAGARQRRVLTLGLPLLAMLDPQERVALIAHELAHDRNGDSTRGLVVGSAIHALSEFYGAIAPEDFGGESNWSQLAIFDRMVNVAHWIVSRPVLGVLWLEFLLLRRDSQRAEYLADALAASVGGSAAVVRLQEKLLLQSTFMSAVQRAVHGRSEETDLFELLVAQVDCIPARERERRRRLARLESARLGESHPPTAKRIELLEARSPVEPQLTASSEDAAAVDAELISHREPLQQKLVDDYRDSLYAR
jgi:Zn-dependent protease with chaperone function